ncbi:recombinase family protein [Rossellomorea marisflavi]|uniref:recombinase family protein n=1 Tax=Rossellomorea marisflavi TaxID=189381 RepID=UPI0011E69FD3|nr:recombinase family protein [Rossellomorea marisflavi]TYO69960.1 recombinase family protein [Rossellomorea marisflavi]
MNNSQKKHVFFRRVSTAGQDIITQEAADLPYREKIDQNQILLINEIAISANKKSIQERPDMKKLMSMVKENKIQTIYAFDRSRLFRDFYDSMQFFDLCKKHNVQIIYTSTGNGSLPATDDVFLEGFLYIFSDLEGKNIARRSKEARLRYPARKFGYTKDKETKSFRFDSAKSESVKGFFQELSSLDSLEELYTLTQKFRKQFNKKDEDLISIAFDPFYAGYDLSKGENKLQHVQPYISLDEFKLLQTSKAPYFKTFVERKLQLRQLDIYSPKCGICEKEMAFRINEVSNSACYICSNRVHSRISVSPCHLKSFTEFVLKNVISNLNSEKLLAQSLKSYRSFKAELTQRLKDAESKMNKIMEALILEDVTYSANWKHHPDYVQNLKLKNEYDLYVQKLNENELAFLTNKELIKTIQESLLDSLERNPEMLSGMLIENLWVYEEKLDVDIFFIEYLEGMDQELILEGIEAV